MIDFPVEAKERFEDYVFMRFKSDDEEVKAKKDSVLLKQIQPAVAKQTKDNEVNMERSTSTTPVYVEKSYAGDELKLEYPRDGLGHSCQPAGLFGAGVSKSHTKPQQEEVLG